MDETDWRVRHLTRLEAQQRELRQAAVKMRDCPLERTARDPDAMAAIAASVWRRAKGLAPA